MEEKAQDNMMEEFVKCRAFWQKKFIHSPECALLMRIHNHHSTYYEMVGDADGLIELVHQTLERESPETSFVEWCNGYGDCEYPHQFPDDDRPCDFYFQKIW